ncbi:cyclase family protein [Frankia sp. Cr2]|uniref:cyclase family protein n=1 Tax=Frankia sp. Cr2 TaxID=3073932 RepID=UPI002AD54325|nr:cyclase family protein [Frankia sp. Cr2]
MHYAPHSVSVGGVRAEGKATGEVVADTHGGPRRPELSNWGRFGADDELGTLNLITPAAVLRGAGCIRTGTTFPLNLPLDQPRHRQIGRPALEKVALRRNHVYKGMVLNDDCVVLPTQGSTQWDALSHCGLVEDGVDGVFYNGAGLDSVDERGYAHRNSIDALAQRGITGRGVLLDVARHVAGGADRPLPPDHVIDEPELLATAAAQGVRIEPGDVVCVRTGWTEAYLAAASDAVREAMVLATDARVPGISPDLAPLAHRQGWGAVATDNIAVEAGPLPTDSSRSAHIRMMRNLGLPFGELFWFADLAAAAAADERWTFLFVAVPLRIPGGIGSPANAIAVR